MEKINEMRIDFTAKSENEAFARIAMGAFLLPLNPTMEEMEDIRTAVSEAVTNAIVHGYRGAEGMVRLAAEIHENRSVWLEIVDCGVGIADITKAREPLYTSCPEMERSGMGFSVMQTFMDTLEVTSAPEKGTTVRMSRHITRKNVDGPFDYRDHKLPVAICR